MQFQTFLALSSLFAAAVVSPAADGPKPLRALLIAGGCCHDYATQKDILKEGLEQRAFVKVDIAYTNDSSTRARFEIYKNPDWARDYDVIIHDECSADVKEKTYVPKILAAQHKTQGGHAHS